MMQVIIKSVAVLFIGLLSQCKTEPSKSNVISEKTNVEVEKEIFDTTHNVNYLMGRFNPATHPLFSLIDVKFADREGLYMRTEAYSSFKKMRNDAEKAGIKLIIRSAARNFDYQKGIWERKWTGSTLLSDESKASDISDPKDRALKILLYSSMPGTSRHHWGTDIDLNSFENEWFESGEGLKLYRWMLDNAESYGFCQVYTAKGKQRPHGYEEEKWHWSFNPISKPLTIYAEKHLKNSLIIGFQGSEAAESIDVVNKYVLGIDPKCM